MKKIIISIFCTFMLVIPSVTKASPRDKLTKALGNPATSQNILETVVPEEVSDKIIEKVFTDENVTKGIEKGIEKLEHLKTVIEKMPIKDEMKTSTISEIDNTITYLKDLEEKLLTSESTEDIKEILKTAREDFKAKKAIIIEKIQELKSQLNGITTEQIEQAIDVIEKSLPLFYTACPDQEESIKVIENNLSEIEELLIKINDDIQGEDYNSAMNEIVASQKMITETALAISVIYKQCANQ